MYFVNDDFLNFVFIEYLNQLVQRVDILSDDYICTFLNIPSNKFKYV
jgi:hypothetical protein